jgi:hypothetical protein
MVLVRMVDSFYFKKCIISYVGYYPLSGVYLMCIMLWELDVLTYSLYCHCTARSVNIPYCLG